MKLVCVTHDLERFTFGKKHKESDIIKIYGQENKLTCINNYGFIESVEKTDFVSEERFKAELINKRLD